MLQFADGSWRFRPPDDREYAQREIPPRAIEEFRALIDRVLTQGDRWTLLEHFKQAFCRAAASPYYRSSSGDWADADLRMGMQNAAANAPLFIEAFVDACTELAKKDITVPPIDLLNDVCARHRIGYILRSPNLLLPRGSAIPAGLADVLVEARPPTIEEQAVALLHESLARADELLREGRGREAVQQTLWVLESLATTFRDIESEGEAVRGTYFNTIARDLRRMAHGQTLAQALRWAEQLHSYLSNPAGGGIRHGRDLKEGVEVDLNGARLFCNLIKSYIGYLLVEHERLATNRG